MADQYDEGELLDEDHMNETGPVWELLSGDRAQTASESVQPEANRDAIERFIRDQRNIQGSQELGGLRFPWTREKVHQETGLRDRLGNWSDNVRYEEINRAVCTMRKEERFPDLRFICQDEKSRNSLRVVNANEAGLSSW